MRSLLPAVLAVALVAVPIAASPAEAAASTATRLLPNPGFESGLGSWTADSGATAVSTTVHAGSGALQIVDASGDQHPSGDPRSDAPRSDDHGSSAGTGSTTGHAAADGSSAAIATGCPFCRVMLSDGLTARQSEGEASESIEVLDVAQLLLESVRRGGAQQTS